MEKTNEKKFNKTKSLFSKFSSKEKKVNKIKKESTVKSAKKIKNFTTLTPEEFEKELDSIVKSNKNAQIVEYYDLPYRYDQTAIKILAQTPHAIFIYWDISDSDRKLLCEKYGNNFFSETKPVLLVHNETLNYSFEVEIDDFTNSWYLRTPTSNCVFNIELGRKKITNKNNISIDSNDNILHITSSNTIKSPNDHILKDSLNKTVCFKNIKTNELEEKAISSFKNIYNIMKIYEDEEFETNPSSDFKI
ncbi:MAG: DUF4912 domain-containing protein [Clostridia bacterium]|nr:DUF4912 domain-containing protein [Clostridia bacterium]